MEDQEFPLVRGVLGLFGSVRFGFVWFFVWFCEQELYIHDDPRCAPRLFVEPVRTWSRCRSTVESQPTSTRLLIASHLSTPPRSDPS